MEFLGDNSASCFRSRPLHAFRRPHADTTAHPFAVVAWANNGGPYAFDS